MLAMATPRRFLVGVHKRGNPAGNCPSLMILIDEDEFVDARLPPDKSRSSGR